MKRTVVLLLTALLTLSSCAGRTAQASFTKSGTDAPSAGTSVGPAGKTQPVRTLPDTDLRSRTADVDLTKSDTQMAYVQLSNMMLSPEDYRGKTIKMRGTFAHATEKNKTFFVCYVMDATACCSQSLEFETDEAYDYPDGYPALESEITVTGVFETYEYNGYAMYRLAHAEVDY